jgi:hypothetical protein
MKGISDSLLCKLWRQAVLKRWGNKCAFCGKADVSVLECHHIIKRRNATLRHDVLNGIPLCKYPPEGKNKSCHAYADTKLGIAKIEKLVGDPTWIYLCNNEQAIIKQTLVDKGMTRNEWLTEQKNKLLEELK